MTNGHPLNPLIGKVRRLATLEPDDHRALLDLPFEIGRVRADRELVREGTVPKNCCLLVEGFAFRSKLEKKGNRQIVSFHIAGDLLDIQHLFLERADHDVHALTEATVAWIPMPELRSLVLHRPRLAAAFWRDALVDASVFREWILNVGRRDAQTRIAHMICEFAARCSAAGLGSPQQLHLPFTQQEIADATGLTPVHVNRMLRLLTERGLIQRDGRTMAIADWDAFRRLADFDSGYLHLAA